MNKWIILLIIVTSANSFASGYFDSNQLANYAPSAQTVSTALSTGVNTVGECALTVGESLVSCKQYTTDELAKAWSSLPRETQQVVLGSAVLASAAYNTPKLYRYLANSLKSRKDDILSQAKGITLIHDAPLETVQLLVSPGQRNLYITVLSLFNYHPNAPQTKRGELLFFKYLKALIEDWTYAIKEGIQQEISLGAIPKSTFMQRWITGRSDHSYQQLGQFISFNKELADIIAQLEKEINAELNIY